MSVLVKGMEMPKSCFECPFMLHRCFCLVNPRIEFTDEEYSELKGRYSGCPLVPVPPHGRLGDLDKLEKMFADIDNAPFSGFDGEDPFYSAADAAQIIRLAPTIIPASEEGET